LWDWSSCLPSRCSTTLPLDPYFQSIWV
jgi:hypothetical protein